MLNYTLEVSNLGTLTAEQFALMLVRFNQLKEIYPPTLPLVQAPLVQRSFVQAGAMEHPLVELYKARTGEKRAACSSADLQRFAGVQSAKGESVPLEVKLKVFTGRLLERKLATQEEITSALEQGANASATFEPLEETPNEGDADAGIDAL